MPTIHELTIPVLTHGLGVLSGYLDKAEAHAAARGLDPAELVGARLAPDMLPLSGQIQRASDTAKASVARLTGLAAPSFPDSETTLAELKERVARTLAFLGGVGREPFDGAEARSIELRFGKFQASYSGADYVTRFMLPNFFFHVTTAHGILRHQGVEVGKLDYLGRFD
ncbi:hypothetical protein SAMN06265365_101523 [Tistlia consotensis]|uniref:DUF1993 domain-containing protein n=1 Tax=Tistlia consotensis USBA 355 TaxID=560819 RepID=A0A1Y6BBR6_9PROT|nr:DUF1993 domain-containing protein [Tistlia consotensis]SME92698.1 hypothetical protein SAMN05428998_101521 [Tistlia consotensis USBA 355]SNR28190.1 hypothetical protein SAMN06265365_101523 [Tistlia consotensis]